MIRGGQPLTWRPKGCSDTVESTSSFNGAMTSLSNLIPDPSTAQLWQCRPASTKKINFVGGPVTTPDTVSVFHVVGDFVYGLIKNTTTGNDIPFAFDLANNVFLTVTGITGANVPQSQATSGAWTPPIMDLIGARLIVTHPGFAATAFFFGWFDISIPTAPVWNAGNLTGAITFSKVPTAVAQFNGRAYYIVNTLAQPAVVFSDPLNAINVTNATQVLTFGDAVPLTAFGQLRLYNQLGGIIQALILFKGVTNTYQITGDAALSNLAINAMNMATGTLAPNSICSTPKGLAFMSPEGMRIIDFQASISDPVGVDGQGITIPFIYTSVPSRICAACNGNIIRVTTQNGNAFNTPFQDWWFDISRKIWHGPHTFPASYIAVWRNTFIMSAVGVTAAIWQSDPMQNATSVFIENTVQLIWTYTTALLPDLEQMTNYQVSQSTLDLALSASAPPITITMQDQNTQVLDSVAIVASGITSAFWNQFQWGRALWGTPGIALAPRQLQWHAPHVFARIQLSASGQSNAQFRAGALRMKYKVLKYLVNLDAVA